MYRNYYTTLPTPVKINNPDVKPLKVLVAPLDWGLGHVTRCIPIIKELINQKCVVIAAVSGVQRTILHREFPDLELVELPGYAIKYGKNRTLTIFQLIYSIPKILIRVNRENRWLRRWAARERPDLVISDNRYGLYLPGVFSIFITHQLLIRTPFGPVADQGLQRMNYAFIRRFTRCWVPDLPGEDGLAGVLSHPVRAPGVPLRYIGWLSRFGEGTRSGGVMRDGDVARDAGVGKVVERPGAVAGVREGSRQGIDLLVLLSGPEPQRTLLEKRIIEQLADYTGRTVVVRGVPGTEVVLKAPPHVTVYDHLPAAELEVMIIEAGQIIARSGYSTVMDLIRLGKRAILIPTPGQTEQEYLGDYLASRGWAVCIQQRGFFLTDAMAVVRGVQGKVLPDPETGRTLLEEEIKEVLAELVRA